MGRLPPNRHLLMGHFRVRKAIELTKFSGARVPCKEAKYENIKPLNYSCMSGVIDGRTMISNLISLI